MLGQLFGRKSESDRTRKSGHAEFERIAMPHADALYGAALRMTRDAGHAEDLVQVTLLGLYRYFMVVDGQSTPRSTQFLIGFAFVSLGLYFGMCPWVDHQQHGAEEGGEDGEGL